MAKGMAVISFRVSPEDYQAIREAAKVAGEPMSTYVRTAITRRMAGVDLASALERAAASITSFIATGTPYRDRAKPKGLEMRSARIVDAPVTTASQPASGALQLQAVGS